MKTGGEVTMEFADTPDSRRHAAYLAAQARRYHDACAADPEAVKLFEQRVEERRKK